MRNGKEKKRKEIEKRRRTRNPKNKSRPKGKAANFARVKFLLCVEILCSILGGECWRRLAAAVDVGDLVCEGVLEMLEREGFGRISMHVERKKCRLGSCERSE